MIPAQRLVVANERTEIGRASAWLAQGCDALELDPVVAYRMDICLNEALANVVAHAFPAGGNHDIVLEMGREAERAWLAVEDDGIEFDPLAHSPRLAAARIEDAEPGGFGIPLIRRFMSSGAHERRAGRNRLVLCFDPPAARRARDVDRRRHHGAAVFPLTLPDGTVVPKERRSGRTRRRYDFISRLHLFASIPYSAVEAVLADCPVRECAEGEVLLEPGQANRHIYLVLEGRLRVALAMPAAGHDILIEAGDCIGEMSIIDGKPASARVLAEAGTRVLLLEQDIFWSRIMAVPGIARNLLATLAERMRLTNDRVLEGLRQELHYQQIERELRIAREIQVHMLPPLSLPGLPEVDVAALMEPAREVGGDFYDLFALDGGRVFLAVGDVAGKGIPAALFMARAITALRLETLLGCSPEALLAQVNRILCENNPGCTFVTMLCAILDPASGELAYANGGHSAPLLVGADGRCEFLEAPRGVPVGVAEDAAWAAASVRLDAGDSILLYTDGVTEAMSAAGECYLPSRLRKCVASLAGASAHDIVEAVRDDVRRFAGSEPASDDITLLALRYLGPRVTH